MNAAQLAGWMPIRLHWQQGSPRMNWCYYGKERFVESFFEDSVAKRLRLPFNALFQHETSLDALIELQQVEPGIAPAGFIFHMSRCGSTLVLQMLAALDKNIVISEAAPIDAVLRANWRDPRITDEQRITWLRGLISAYARPRNGEQRFFIKFDSWHTLELPLIQRAFPEAPWIFMYRDPVQVLVSHQRQRGGAMAGLVPSQWLGLDQLALGEVSPDEYTSRLLKRICECALQHLNGHARLINYTQLPAAVPAEIATHFQTTFSSADLEAMFRSAQFDAKNRSMTFVADTTDKERAAGAELRQLAETWLTPVYNALEARRQL